MTKVAGLPAFRDVNNKMCQGLNLIDESHKAAVRMWYQAWQDVVLILDNTSIKSMDEFEERFRGVMTVCQLIQEIDATFSLLSEDEPKYLEQRIEFCESVLPRYQIDVDSHWVNCVIRSGLAESYLLAGQRDKANELYEVWMEQYPTWAMGWIDWSDCFLMSDYLDERPERVEAILRKGIERCGPKHRYELMDRLAEILEYFGREDDATELRKLRDAEKRPLNRKKMEAEKFWKLMAKVEKSFWNVDTVSQGRREPCTCGSGKKYKNCCDVEIR